MKRYQSYDSERIPKALRAVEVAIAKYGVPDDPVVFAAEHGLHVAIVVSVSGVRCPGDVILKEQEK